MLILRQSTKCWRRILPLLSAMPEPLKVLLLPEEHGKADDGAVDQQAPDNGHDQGRSPDQLAMREYDRQRCVVRQPQVHTLSPVETTYQHP